MDDFGGFVVAVVIIVLVAMLAVVGIAVIAFVAVVGSIGFLTFLMVKGIVFCVVKFLEEQERMRLEVAEQQRILARQAADDAERERILRQDMEERERQRKREEELRQREQQRKAEEEAARQRLEAERDEAEHAFATWNGGLRTRKPSPEQVNAIVEEGNRIHSHCGKVLYVIAVVGRSGAALEWKAHTGAGCIPQVIGLRGTEEMFSEWAFAGRHTALLQPGRHKLAFRVNQTGQATGGEIDLAFEIFVPTEEIAGSTDQFKAAVNATAKAFIDRTNTVAQAKREVEEALAAHCADQDEIDVEMSKLEVQLKDLPQGGGGA